MFNNNSEQQAEQKLMLLYIFNQFEIPLTNDQITQFVMENDYMNYFLLQQFLGELVSSGMIEYSSNEKKYFYLITEKGKNALIFFKGRLSKSLKDSIDMTVEQKKQVMSREMEIRAEYEKKKENEYIVDLQVIENDTSLIELKLNVASNKQAKLICDKWRKEAPELYGSIIHLLIKES
ncbi:MAG: DUF4364 family protein [Bacillota bacterium]